MTLSTAFRVKKSARGALAALVAGLTLAGCSGQDQPAAEDQTGNTRDGAAVPPPLILPPPEARAIGPPPARVVSSALD